MLTIFEGFLFFLFPALKKNIELLTVLTVMEGNTYLKETQEPTKKGKYIPA